MRQIIDLLRAGMVTTSADETQQAAEALARILPADTTLALHGNLGVGKTTFVQGLARGFGLIDHITSPTFTIYNVHRGPNRTLIHLDAYRIENSREVDDLLLEDFLTSPWCLAVEWPEKIGDWLPADAWHVELSIGPQQHHAIKLR